MYYITLINKVYEHLVEKIRHLKNGKKMGWLESCFVHEEIPISINVQKINYVPIAYSTC